MGSDEEAEEADRVCVIDHGRIATLGTPDELKARLLERAVVVDAQDREALATELRALGLEPTADEDGRLRVPYASTTAQDVIGRIRTPLTSLRIHEPSLEEAYVALLHEPQEVAA